MQKLQKIRATFILIEARSCLKILIYLSNSVQILEAIRIFILSLKQCDTIGANLCK